MANSALRSVALSRKPIDKPLILFKLTLKSDRICEREKILQTSETKRNRKDTRTHSHTYLNTVSVVLAARAAASADTSLIWLKWRLKKQPHLLAVDEGNQHQIRTWSLL